MLKRLSKGKTQNANECIHSVIWARCSKTVFMGKFRVDAAVASAISSFNIGATQLTEVMARLGAEANLISSCILEAMDSDRIAGAKRQSQDDFVTQRRVHEQQLRRHQAQQIQEEGVTYGAGEF